MAQARCLGSNMHPLHSAREPFAREQSGVPMNVPAPTVGAIDFVPETPYMSTSTLSKPLFARVLAFGAGVCACALLAGCGGGAGGGVANPSTTTINGIQVPPDPGPANDATLAGIDANHNGVRDDVERAIAARYGNNLTEWRAAMQAARADQMSVVADGNPSASQAANVAEMKSGACLVDAFEPEGDSSLVTKASGFVYALTLNTSSRYDAFYATQSVETPFQGYAPGQACE